MRKIRQFCLVQSFFFLQIVVQFEKLIKTIHKGSLKWRDAKKMSHGNFC